MVSEGHAEEYRLIRIVGYERQVVTVQSNPRTLTYAPDKQERATQTVLEQAEVLSEGWVAA
jgi:hypothetical protein